MKHFSSLETFFLSFRFMLVWYLQHMSIEKPSIEYSFVCESQAPPLQIPH